MTDAYKHLRKKGMSYKDKKDLLKSIPKTAFDYSLLAPASAVININDDVDLFAFNSSIAQIIAFHAFVYRLKNDNEFTKFLE